MKPATFAPSTVFVRRSPKRISGSATRFSQTTKPTSSAAESAKTPSVRPEPQPHSLPCVIASTSAVKPDVTSTAPSCVERLHPGVAALLEQDRRQREGGEADRDVDEEDPLPREGVGEHAAEQHARCGAEAADRAPDAERDVPLTAFREGGHQDRERCRRDRGCAEALNRAGADQRRLGPGETAQQRPDREQDQADHEDAPAAEQVGRAAAQQQEAAEDERVGGDHPLEVRLRESEIRLDRGECDVHDRDVEHDHELDGGEKRQSEPFQSR